MGQLLLINTPSSNWWHKCFLYWSCMNDIWLKKQKILWTQPIPVMKKWLCYPWETKMRTQCALIKQHCKQWLYPNRLNKITFMKLTPMSMRINSNMVCSSNVATEYTAFEFWKFKWNEFQQNSTSLSVTVQTNVCSVVIMKMFCFSCY